MACSQTCFPFPQGALSWTGLIIAGNLFTSPLEQGTSHERHNHPSFAQEIVTVCRHTEQWQTRQAERETRSLD